MLGILSEQALRTDGMVQLRHLQFVAEPAAVASPVVKANQTANSASAVSDERVHISVQGIAIDDQAVSLYLQSLKSTGAFATLDLRQTGDRELESIRVREFSIECESPYQATRVAVRSNVTQ